MSAALPAPSPAVRAWGRLLEVHKLALAEVRRELAFEVSLSRFDLLANLHREDAQTLASLSRRMLVTAGNLTGLVDRAERDRLVRRTPDAHDRRATRVTLTRRGLALYAEALTRHQRRVEAVFDALSRKEQHALSSLLGDVRRSLRRPQAAPQEKTP